MSNDDKYKIKMNMDSKLKEEIQEMIAHHFYLKLWETINNAGRKCDECRMRKELFEGGVGREPEKTWSSLGLIFSITGLVVSIVVLLIQYCSC